MAFSGMGTIYREPPIVRSPLRFVILTMLLVSAIPAPVVARHFEVLEPGMDTPCVMVDIELRAEIRAVKDDEDIAVRNITLEGENVTTSGACDENQHKLDIYFQKNSMWGIAFQPYELYPVAMYRVLEFVPTEIFDGVVSVTDSQLFSDLRPVYQSDAEKSYLCEEEDIYSYESYTPTSEITFEVSVTVVSIHAQGYGLKDRHYGPAKNCLSPTGETTTVTTKTTSMKPTFTTPPTPETTTLMELTTNPNRTPIPKAPAPVNSYAVGDSDIMCIAMTTAITLTVLYPYKGSEYVLQKAIFNVPISAQASGNCHSPDATQALDIQFFNSWSLNITFSKYDADKPLLSGRRNALSVSNSVFSYGISNMSLTVVTDKERFPNWEIPPGTSYTYFTEWHQNIHKINSEYRYFQCDSPFIYNLSADFHVTTEDLQFLAFNNNSNADFCGRADVCSADKAIKPRYHGSPNLPLILGVVAASIMTVVVAGLLVELISRRWRRSKGSID